MNYDDGEEVVAAVDDEARAVEVIREPERRLAVAPMEAAAGFAAMMQPFQGNATALAAAMTAAASVRESHLMARQFPRSWGEVRERVLVEAKDPEFAQTAVYEFPRGKGEDGKKNMVRGVSIRGAELLAQLAGNMETTTEVVYEDDRVRRIRVRTVDYEHNSAWAAEATVPRTVERHELQKGQVPLSQRTTSEGKTIYTVAADEHAFAAAVGTAASKIARNNVLRHIRASLVREFRDACLATRKKTDAQKMAENPTKSRQALYDAFRELGIGAKDLDDWFGHDPALMNVAEYQELRGIYGALREKACTWQDALDARREGKPAPKKGSPQPAGKSTPPDPKTPAESGGEKPVPAPSAPSPAAAEGAAGQAALPGLEGSAGKADEAPDGGDELAREVASLLSSLEAAGAKSSREALAQWNVTEKARLDALPQADQATLRKRYGELKAALKK